MDNPIALQIAGVSVYWHGIIILIAALVTVIMAALLHRSQGGSAHEILTVIVVGFIPAFVLGRIYYCHFAQAGFSDKSKMAVLGSGGIALYGIIAGYIIIAIVYCLICKKPFAKLADAAAPAAALGIAIGRSASFFSKDDIGRSVTDENMQHLPFAIFTESQNEWRVAVFIFEAAAALIICAVLLAVFYRLNSVEQSRMKRGDIALLFLLFYGVSQTVFESMRSDSMLLISLGFVRIAQVISIILATVVFVIFSIRSAKKGVITLHYAGWVLCLLAVALAFWMEFCITSANVVRNYTLMILCLTFYMLTALAMYFDSISDYTKA